MTSGKENRRKPEENGTFRILWGTGMVDRNRWSDGGGGQPSEGRIPDTTPPQSFAPNRRCPREPDARPSSAVTPTRLPFRTDGRRRSSPPAEARVRGQARAIALAVLRWADSTTTSLRHARPSPPAAACARCRGGPSAEGGPT